MRNICSRTSGCTNIEVMYVLESKLESVSKGFSSVSWLSMQGRDLIRKSCLAVLSTLNKLSRHSSTLASFKILYNSAV